MQQAFKSIKTWNYLQPGREIEWLTITQDFLKGFPKMQSTATPALKTFLRQTLALQIFCSFWHSICSSKHSSENKKAFLYLLGMDSTRLKWVPCSILDYLSVRVQSIKHINKMPSFAQTFKGVSYSSNLTN